MNRLIEDTRKLKEWYQSYARPFLEGNIAPEKLAEFDKDLGRIAKIVDVCEKDLAVCFLGSSGVGKSTLVNAMLGGRETVVPSGGVGPLTAQALVVQYSEKPGFDVEYHGAGPIWKTIMGLEWGFKKELGPALMVDEPTPEELGEQDEVYLPSAEVNPTEALEDDITQGEAGPREGTKELKKRAQLLVAGVQDSERPLQYLLDSLRQTLGHKRIWLTQPNPEDEPRLKRIKEAIELAKRKQTLAVEGTRDDPGFRLALHEHATGFLAPLIKKLTLRWNAPILSNGILLVDLPGVGIVQDVHKEITRKWIREEAHALVMVVDHRGIPNEVADASREFLNSLLYSDEPDDDPILIAVVTRIDDLASDGYRQDKSRKKAVHFEEAAKQAKEKFPEVFRKYFEDLWISQSEAAESRKDVVHGLLSRLQVHPVSAPEFNRLVADDDDDRSFLRDVERTGIPEFVRSLSALAEERRSKALDTLAERCQMLHSGVLTTIDLIEAQWESGSRAAEEAESLRRDLEGFMAPLRGELQRRQGAYRQFLKTGAPQRIRDLVGQSKLKASASISRYLRRLEGAHWATLKASVTRGGRFSGALQIDLPAEFALRFEEPIAEIWGKDILKSIRHETKNYAQSCVGIVEEVTNWALEQHARVQAKLIEAQRDLIRADAKRLETVGREMVKELRDDVRAQLIERIEGPIRKRCAQFVAKNEHIGVGVKQRILALYEELPDLVADAAEEPTNKILGKLFKEVEKEILEAFLDHQDPLEAAVDAIVQSHQSTLGRSDAQKRRRVLEEIGALRKALPNLDRFSNTVRSVSLQTESR